MPLFPRREISPGPITREESQMLNYALDQMSAVEANSSPAGNLESAQDSMGIRYVSVPADPLPYDEPKTTAPVVTDDDDAGFTVGDIWIDETNDTIYVLVDNSTGAAIWLVTGGTTQTVTDITITGTVTFSSVTVTLDIDGGTIDIDNTTIVLGGTTDVTFTFTGGSLDFPSTSDKTVAPGAELHVPVSSDTGAPTYAASNGAIVIDGGNQAVYAYYGGWFEVGADSHWTDGGTELYPTTTSLNILLGLAGTAAAQLDIPLQSDKVGLRIKAHTTQVNDLLLVEDDAGNDYFKIDGSGDCTFDSVVTVSIPGILLIPNGTGVGPATSGEIALDTDGNGTTFTTGVLKGYDGTQTINLFGPSGYPSSDNDVIAFDSASSTVTWQAQLQRVAASQAEMEAASDNTVMSTPGRAIYHPGSAKWWLKYDQAAATINASWNVTSVDDDAAGDFGVNLDNSFSSADWVPVSMNQYVEDNAAGIGARVLEISRATAAMGAGALQCRTAIADSPYTMQDLNMNCIVGFGDL